jgi:hypothetical protein
LAKTGNSDINKVNLNNVSIKKVIPLRNVKFGDKDKASLTISENRKMLSVNVRLMKNLLKKNKGS